MRNLVSTSLQILSSKIWTMEKVETLNIVKIKTLYNMLQTLFKNMFFWLRYCCVVLIPCYRICVSNLVFGFDEDVLLSLTTLIPWRRNIESAKAYLPVLMDSRAEFLSLFEGNNLFNTRQNISLLRAFPVILEYTATLTGVCSFVQTVLISRREPSSSLQGGRETRTKRSRLSLFLLEVSSRITGCYCSFCRLTHWL